jgi:hypothetical protein
MSAVIAAAMFAQLVVVGGDPATCKKQPRVEHRPSGSMSVRALLDVMAKNDCVRYVVPSHLLFLRVELPESLQVAKDWRGPVQHQLDALGLSLHAEPMVRVDGPPAPPPQQPISDEELDRGVHCDKPAHCVLSHKLLDKLLADSTTLATSARFVPSMHDGKPDGFRLFAIRPDSLLARLGFENGDTVQTINGMDMTTPDKALEIYTKLRSSNELAVGIVRRGKPLTIQIDIR